MMVSPLRSSYVAAHMHTREITHTRTHTHTHHHTHTHTFTLLTHTHSHTHSLTHSLFHSLSLSLSHDASTRAHTRTHTHAQTHTAIGAGRDGEVDTVGVSEEDDDDEDSVDGAPSPAPRELLMHSSSNNNNNNNNNNNSINASGDGRVPLERFLVAIPSAVRQSQRFVCNKCPHAAPDRLWPPLPNQVLVPLHRALILSPSAFFAFIFSSTSYASFSIVRLQSTHPFSAVRSFCCHILNAIGHTRTYTHIQTRNTTNSRTCRSKKRSRTASARPCALLWRAK
jgi:hypothetical protein